MVGMLGMRRDWYNRREGNYVWDVKIINKQPTNKVNIQKEKELRVIYQCSSYKGSEFAMEKEKKSQS